jgi:CHASE1-domain containing sensor protein
MIYVPERPFGILFARINIYALAYFHEYRTARTNLTRHCNVRINAILKRVRVTVVFMKNQ